MLLLIFSSSVFAQTTGSIIQVLDPATVTLNTTESSKLAQLQNNPITDSWWHINVNSLSSCLSGTTLATTLPGVSGAKSFTADYVFSRPDGEYYWSGANASGEQIRLGKAGTGYYGNISLPGSDFYYGIHKLSDTRYVLIKYDADLMANPNECGMPPAADAEEDSDVEDRSSCDGNVIRVLFLFTSAAVSSGFDPYVVAPAVIAELNSTTTASGLTNSDISFALANVGQLNGFTESTLGTLVGMSLDLETLIANTDAQNARSYSKADVVILLTGPAYGSAAGLAGDIAAAESRAYAIAVIEPAATSFTATHEIGHLIGARHQRCSFCGISSSTTGCDDNPNNYHGFPIGSTGFRTIMMQLSCPGARVGRWSNPDVTFMGAATGDESNKNAAILKKRADNVACFLADPSTPIYPYFDSWVYLSGPYSVCDGDDEQPYSVSYSSLWFTAPVTYTWSISDNGVAPWTNLSCNSNQCTVTGINNLPAVFFVRATVTDVNGRTGSAIFKIKKVQCRPGRSRDDGMAETNERGVVQPNPFTDVLTLKDLAKDTRLSIVDINGRILERYYSKEENPEFIWNLSNNLMPGLYFLRLENNESIQNFKIIKQ